MFNIWVNNVNNWRVGVGISQGYINTEKLVELQIYITSWAKQYFSIFTPTCLYPTISTYNNAEFNLLNKSFTTNPQRLLLRLINEI